jgi:hypothetical protein
MTTRKLGSLAAALGVAALIFTFSHEVLGQSPQTSPAPAGSASSEQTGSWHTMTGPDHSFTADLPAEPKYTTTPMKTSAGSGYVMHQYLLELGAVAYVVQTAVYPADVNVSNHKVNLQGGLDNAAKNMEGGKWASIGWVTHQGLTGVDAIGVRGEHAIRSFSVMKGRQIVTLTYAGPAGSARSPDVDRFVASLRVGP